MSTFTKTMGAATIGGILVYFLDPDTGRRRRALVKDRAVNLVKEADRAIGKASRDLSNRARGTVAETRSRLPLRNVSDEVLSNRFAPEWAAWPRSHISWRSVPASPGLLAVEPFLNRSSKTCSPRSLPSGKLLPCATS